MVFLVGFQLTLFKDVSVYRPNMPIKYKLKNLLFLLQHWTDYSLIWNASEYGDLQSIRVPPTMIWKPDILLYNR